MYYSPHPASTEFGSPISDKVIETSVAPVLVKIMNILLMQLVFVWRFY
jgi:hypothetical protein